MQTLVRNRQLTTKEVQSLPLGIFFHKEPNRSKRRAEENKKKPGNNRVKTKCRQRYMGMEFKSGKFITMDILRKLYQDKK
jgi:hypothetical protein